MSAAVTFSAACWWSCGHKPVTKAQAHLLAAGIKLCLELQGPSVLELLRHVNLLNEVLRQREYVFKSLRADGNTG